MLASKARKLTQKANDMGGKWTINNQFIYWTIMSRIKRRAREGFSCLKITYVDVKLMSNNSVILPPYVLRRLEKEGYTIYTSTGYALYTISWKEECPSPPISALI